MDELTKEDFERQLETAFTFDAGTGNGATLLLKEVAGSRYAPEAKGRPFSLIFESASALPQRTYRFEHAVLGSIEIFIVPIARKADRFLYEAVFN